MSITDEATINVLEVNRVADGDVLVKFSDGTIVLFLAEFLYSVRGQDSNVQIVDPFEE